MLERFFNNNNINIFMQKILIFLNFKYYLLFDIFYLKNSTNRVFLKKKILKLYKVLK